jgi:hypothetical protein
MSKIQFNCRLETETRDAINRLRGDRSQSEFIDLAVKLAVIAEGAGAPFDAPREESVDIPALRGEALMSLRWWAKEDGVDFATVITRALAVYDTSRTTVKDQVLDDVSAARVAEPVDDDRPKNCKCAHCPRRFAGRRGSTLCRVCENSGHYNEPAECPQCTAGLAI